MMVRVVAIDGAFFDGNASKASNAFDFIGVISFVGRALGRVNDPHYRSLGLTPAVGPNTTFFGSRDVLNRHQCREGFNAVPQVL